MLPSHIVGAVPYTAGALSHNAAEMMVMRCMVVYKHVYDCQRFCVPASVPEVTVASAEATLSSVLCPPLSAPLATHPFSKLCVCSSRCNEEHSLHMQHAAAASMSLVMITAFFGSELYAWL